LFAKGRPDIIQNGGDIADGATYVSLYVYLYISMSPFLMNEFGKLSQNAIEIYLLKFAIS
jgi:hypothetical protein